MTIHCHCVFKRRSEPFVEAESFSSMVHAFTVVDSGLWACLGDGYIAIYDVETRFPRKKVS